MSMLLVLQPAIATPSVEIQITGITGNLQKNVLRMLSIEQQKTHPMLSAGRIRRLHNKAEVEIQVALQPYGFYRATVDKSLNQLGEENWQAIYTINPGPALLINQLDLQLSGSGQQDEELSRLFSEFPLSQGDVLDQVRYEQGKSDILKLATEQGYFDGRFTEHRIDIDLEAYTSSITLRYDSGTRYQFGKVSLHQDILNASLMQRYASLKENDPYSVTSLIELQQALNNSDYFSEVEIRPHPRQEGSLLIPIDVQLQPRKRHKYTFGLGYGSDTGPRGKLGYEVTPVNRRGHRLDSEFKTSEVTDSFTANYRIPIRNPRSDQWVLNTSIVDTKTDTSESLARTFGTSLIIARGHWQHTSFVNFQEERFTVADIVRRSRLLIPGLTVSRVWAEDRINTLHGFRLDLSLRGATKALISDTGFIQGQVHIKSVNTVLRQLRLISRGTIGITGVPDFDELPTSVRFFAGGSQSIRGYKYKSLGPTNNQGQIVGGKHLLTASAELDYAVYQNWGLAVFLDAGNALDVFPSPIKRGAGFGFRWKSPVGPIRFDLAWAISEVNKPWRIHINIGPDL